MNIIISMTSFGDRLKQLHNYLGWVKFVPYQFHLYIGKNEIISPELIAFFDTTKNANLHRVEDIGPITKSYYSLQEFPDDIVFLIDDDELYNPYWIKFAIDSYMVHQSQFRDCVIGLVARKLIYNANNELEIMHFGDSQDEFQKSLNYFTGHAQPLTKSFRNVILSGAPGSFLNIRQVHKDYFDINLYNKLSKSHDEVWNWAQSVRLGYKHVGLHTSRIALPPIQGTTENNLTVRFNSIEHEREIFKGLLETFPEIKTRINLEM